MWVITGGTGFIGSALLWKLNQEGMSDLWVVDLQKTPDERKNLQGKRFTDYMEAYRFKDELLAGRLPKIEGIVHLGACSSTTETDAAYLNKNNYEYTKSLAEWALGKKAKFIYASSAATYGDGGFGYTTDPATTEKLKPLNLYGESKQRFDLWAQRAGVLKNMVGMKYFNVYGPNEYHKEDMRSMVAKAYEQIGKEGGIRLFKSDRPDYRDGEQVRDFLYVKDAVNVTYEFMNGQGYGGLYNVGSGKARSWNDLAKAVFAAMGKPVRIEYVPMPETIRSRYQYHTQADMTWMGKKTDSFMTLEAAVSDYVKNYLSKEDPYL